MSPRRRVLITGAAGRIGSFLAQHFAERYALRLSDVRPPAGAVGSDFVQADVGDLDAMRRLCEGVDTVVHLAADASATAPWEELLPRNVIGAYNAFEAAAQAGCRRVVFASSVHAVWAYPREVQVSTEMPTRPATLYGATKVWGEGLASHFAEARGISAICLRFGWVVSADSPHIRPDHPYLDIVLTYDDLALLVAAAIDAPDDLRYRVYQGVSNNRWKRLDISTARSELGYRPAHDAFVIAGIYQDVAGDKVALD